MTPDRATPAPPSPTRTLRDVLAEEGRFPFDRAARLLDELATALRELHARGAAYGGLEPGRVLLDAAGRVSLADPATGEAPVSPAYLAPELIDGRAADPRSDIYSLGLLGWEMLAGRSPWAGESLYNIVVKQREQDLPRLTTLRPGIPRPLLLAIEGALHKHPYDRWGTMEEFLAQLRAGRTGPASRPGAEPRVAAPAAPAAPATAAAPPAVPPPPPRPGVTTVAAGPAAPPRQAPPPSAVGARGAARPRGRRWLTGAALALALFAAGAAGLVAVQGRTESGETAAWLDSLATDVEAGDVLIDSTLDSAVYARRVREARLARARRDSIARAEAERRAAEANPDSVAAAAAADSAQRARADSADSAARRDTLARPDTTARRDTTVRRDTTMRPDSGATGTG